MSGPVDEGCPRSPASLCTARWTRLDLPAAAEHPPRLVGRDRAAGYVTADARSLSTIVDEVLKAEPTEDTRLVVAAIDAATTNCDEAMALLARAEQGGRYGTLLARALVCRDHGRADEAVAWLRRAARAGEPRVALAAAGLLCEALRENDARRVLEAVAGKDPEALIGAAILAWRARQLDRAERLLRQAESEGDPAGRHLLRDFAAGGPAPGLPRVSLAQVALTPSRPA